MRPSVLQKQNYFLTGYLLESSGEGVPERLLLPVLACFGDGAILGWKWCKPGRGRPGETDLEQPGVEFGAVGGERPVAGGRFPEGVPE
jgi:hypothetical protein